MKTRNRFQLIFLFIFAILFIFFQEYSSAQTEIISAGTNNVADAIAVRIIPNPEHYSIERWYANQGFSGSPQTLVVDGYDAIRDGRTVYVNAANIDIDDKVVYTNIYLISYSQDPVPNTVDILGQIISHWKFNSNLVDEVSATCSISSVSCEVDSDCGEEQFCADSSMGIASSSCLLKTTKNCLTDTDCPSGFFCDSTKSKITRDMKRVGQLEELKRLLANFKNLNKNYPLLSAGTYYSGNTLSVWPSWSKVFLVGLGASRNFVDPINRLGSCPGYDKDTCWNQEKQQFFSDLSAESLVMPAGSYAIAYSVDSNGSKYNLCSVLESRENVASLGYKFLPNDPGESACIVDTGIFSEGQAGNTPPKLEEVSLTGQANKEFNGFVRVKDEENNPLSWVISTDGAWSGWVNGPILMDTSNPNQKKIYAEKAGGPGNYILNLIVSDGRGGTLATSSPVVILGSTPFIEAEDAEYAVNTQNPFEYSLYFSGNNITNPGDSYDISFISGPFDLLKSFEKPKIIPAGVNRYQVKYEGIITLEHQFTEDVEFKYTVRIKDEYSFSSKTFTIKIITESPQIILECSTLARLGQPYDCLVGSIIQGNHQVEYSSIDRLPQGLSLVEDPKGIMNLRGETTAATNGQTVNIRAVNEYGAEATKSFILKVNTFCGDGIKQLPNREGRGGIYNDGYEDCDVNDGITNNVASSSVAMQYGCQTVDSNTPNPIPNSNYCVFKSPLKGGGYCGDGVCQCLADKDTGVCTLENCWNCQSDCGNCIATIESYAKEEQISYFNGKRLYKTNNINSLGSATTTLLSGENALSFWTHTVSDNQGLSFRMLVGPTISPFDVIDSSNSVLRCSAVSSDRHTFNQEDSVLSGVNHDPANDLFDGEYNWTEPEFTETSGFASSIVADGYSSLSKIKVLTGEDTGPLPYVWGNPLSQRSFYCRLNYNYLNSNLGVCRPACVGRECGDDGCGGSCGDCSNKFPDASSDFLGCSDGECFCTPDCADKLPCAADGCGGQCPSACPPGESCVQMSVDDYHATYFNNSLVASTSAAGVFIPGVGTTPCPVNWGSANCWKVIQAFNVAPVEGKNVFAIKAFDKGGLYGIAAQFMQGCQAKTTNDTIGWKCSSVNPGSGWTSVNYTENVNWRRAYGYSTNEDAGNALYKYGINQIWARTAEDTLSTASTVWCRYTFYLESIAGQTTCTSWDYSDWGDCSGGIQTRTILEAYPEGCAGGSPILSRPCIEICDCNAAICGYNGPDGCYCGSCQGDYVCIDGNCCIYDDNSEGPQFMCSQVM